MERPDLSGVDAAVREYIEALERELAQRSRPAGRVVRVQEGATGPDEEEPQFFEPPTTLQVITVSASGIAKRTARHLYGRQRRGGMGIFDLDTPGLSDGPSDPPAWLMVADETSGLLLITNRARAFRVPVADIPAAPVRARGKPLASALGLYAGEQIVTIMPGERSTYAALLSQKGWALCIPGHILGGGPARDDLRPNLVLFDVAKYGAPVAACWARSDQDLLMATRKGLAVRLAVKKVPNQGCLGIRLDPDDSAVATVAVGEDDGVFLLGADGKGTVRLMPGFGAFKSPGAGGKVLFKTDKLVGALRVTEKDDLFVISRSSKIIRFAAAEVPPKEGVVQGVNCISLRADESVALATSTAVG
jgi:DNA gyrase/topoisomerase IV subunit A